MSTGEPTRRTRLGTRTLIATATMCTLMLTACGSDKADSKDVAVSFGSGAAAQRDVPLGADDVRITSSDGVLVLSLIGDTVRMQLSDSLRNSVANEINKDADKGNAIAAMVTKSVSAAVSGAMGFVVHAPAKDVQDLRYENGHIRFNMRGGNVNVKSDGDNRRDNATFSADDAKKFIDAVKKKQNATEAM